MIDMKSAVLGALLAAVTVGAADWPCFFGPNANGISSETGLNLDWKTKPPPQVWSVALGDNGYAAPAVAGGVVYIIDHQGKEDVVLALDLATGKEAWRFAYPDDSKHKFGYSKTTPVIDHGKIYVLGQMGQVHCLEAKTGRELWTHNLLTEFGGKLPEWDYAMSPLLDGEKLILCPGGAVTVLALDKTSGATIWKSTGPGDVEYATPAGAAIEGKRQYLIFSRTSLNGLDAGDGKLLWSFPWKTQFCVHAAMPLPLGNTVFINSGYDHGCALIEINGSQAKAKWESKELISRFTTPVCADGVAYCTGEKNALVCLDLKTGTAKWQQPGFEWGGLVAVDGTLIVLDGKTGEIVLIRLSPERYEELGRMKGLGGQSWTAPIVAGGRLLVRNKQTLACYDLRVR